MVGIVKLAHRKVRILCALSFIPLNLVDERILIFLLMYAATGAAFLCNFDDEANLALSLLLVQFALWERIQYHKREI